VIQVGVPLVGDVKKCEFQKVGICADVVG